jgi:pseudouridine kinase
MSATIAAVIGTVFIDCKGFSSGPYYPFGRNLGTVEFIHGGVGRNVAENLANLDVETYFVSSVDANALGREVVTRLERSGVHTPYIAEAEQRGMGMWLAVLEQDGNLAGSISHMPELNAMERIMAEKGEEMVRRSSHIALELDLNADLSSKVLEMARNHHRPIFGIPGNLDVIINHPHFLQELACFICNHFEAERLFGVELDGHAPEYILERLIEFADSRSIASMVVTLGSDGSVYYDRVNKLQGYQPAFSVEVVDSSGAGDAFFSGTVMGLMKGMALREAVICGTWTAAWTIQSKENTCPDLRVKSSGNPAFTPTISKVK